MTDLKRAKERLAELNRLVSEAEQPGAYINTLAEERREVEFSIKMLEQEARIDQFITENSGHFAAMGVGPAELRGMIEQVTREADWERTKDLGKLLAEVLKK